MKQLKRSADVVIVGSGPGGSTVGRELAAAGWKVVLLEKGRHHRFIGNHFTALRFADRMGLSFSEEGLHLVRGFITGGSTIMYCGSAMEPPEWFKSRFGIDLAPYTAATIRELSLEPLPDDVVGFAGLRIMDAANSMGHKFEKMRKFINPSKCKMHCGGTCMLGCPHGAKWTAREYLEQMKASGGELITRADVQEVKVQDGTATGVIAGIPGGRLEVDAKYVVVSAGGLGTPSILQRSGIFEAGVGLFVDPLVFVTGVSNEKGTCQGPPMTVGTSEMLDEGILLSDLIDPWGMWIIMTLLKNPGRIFDFFSYRRHMGLMVKIGDERSGFVTADGRVSKPLTERDRYKLNKGAAISRKILIKAGCDPDTVQIGPVRGAHPGSTARIGEIVDADLQTKFKNLYVSDASVIPEALDRPVVLTVISLAKRLADHLKAKGK
jgi:choline dehydrogenase-like flavoprotein